MPPFNADPTSTQATTTPLNLPRNFAPTTVVQPLQNTQLAATPTPTLDDASRQKLDGIVQQMQANKESDQNIQAVVNDFKQKYAAAPILTPKQQIDANYQVGAFSKDPTLNAATAGLQDFGEASRQTLDALSSPLSPIGWATRGIGAAANGVGGVIKAVVDPFASAAGGALRNVVGADNADKVGQGLVNVANNPVTQGLIKTYSAPDVTGDLGALGNVANLAGTVVGARSAAEGFADLPSALDTIKTKISGPPPTAPDVVGKITQATPAELPAASRALSTIDTTGVKTFPDLSSKLDAQIKANTASVDAELGTKTDTFKPTDVTKVHPVDGGAPVAQNPVGDALDQLSKFYEKTNDPADFARIKTLQTKFETNGLILQDMNAIAREHGAALNGYNANGELASGLTKQAAENTRQALKSTVRELNGPSDTTGATDKNTADLIRTKEMIDEMSQKVQQLENRIQQLGPLQKIGRFAGKAIDLASGGLLKGFFKQILDLGKDDGTRLDPIQLQDNLAKNLRLLDQLSSMKPADAVQALSSVVSLPPTK